MSNPVVGNGVVYVLDAAANQLQARDLATGLVLWTWAPDAFDSLPVGNLVLTSNLIFVSTSVKTYAIDLASHLPVWSASRAGALALSSNKMLYVVSNTRVDAFNLAPH